MTQDWLAWHDGYGSPDSGPGAWSVGVHRNTSAAARPIRDRLFTFIR